MKLLKFVLIVYKGQATKMRFYKLLQKLCPLFTIVYFGDDVSHIIRPKQVYSAYIANDCVELLLRMYNYYYQRGLIQLLKIKKINDIVLIRTSHFEHRTCPQKERAYVSSFLQEQNVKLTNIRYDKCFYAHNKYWLFNFKNCQ